MDVHSQCLCKISIKNIYKSNDMGNFTWCLNRNQILNALPWSNCRQKIFAFITAFLWLPNKLISRNNWKRLFHTLLLEICKRKWIIKKGGTPDFISNNCVHRRYKPNFTAFLSLIFIQHLHFWGMGIIIFAANLVQTRHPPKKSQPWFTLAGFLPW